MRNLDRCLPFVFLALASCSPSATPPAQQPSSSPSACEPGHDQTCNDDPAVSSLWGRCEQGRCVCNDGFAVNPESGRCRPAQPDAG